MSSLSPIFSSPAKVSSAPLQPTVAQFRNQDAVSSQLAPPSLQQPSLMATLSNIISGVRELGRFASAASTAAQQAQGDPRSIFSKAQEFGTLAQALFQNFSRAQGESSQAFVDAFGQAAQGYLQNSIKDGLIDEATKYFGYNSGSLGATDFLNAGIDWISSGFNSGAFKNSLDAASLANQAGAAPAEGGAVTTGLDSTANTILGGVGAAYSAYNLFKNWGNGDIVGGLVNGASSGAFIGSIVPGVGTAIGGVVGGLIGAVSSLFRKSGKHEDQKDRDKVRAALIEHGMLPNDYCLTLANGSKYDIGKDGGYRLINTDGGTRHAYDVDFSNPLAGRLVGMAQGFISVLMGSNQKLTSDFTGYVVNAALSNASTLEDARANLLSIFQQFKIDPEMVAQEIGEMTGAGALSQDVALAYANGLRDLLTTSTDTIAPH